MFTDHITLKQCLDLSEDILPRTSEKYGSGVPYNRFGIN